MWEAIGNIFTSKEFLGNIHKLVKAIYQLLENFK